MAVFPSVRAGTLDVQLQPIHFFYYAGWADKLDYAFSEKDAKPASMGRSSHGISHC